MSRRSSSFGMLLTSVSVAASLVVGQVGLAASASAGERGYRSSPPAFRHYEQAPRHYGYRTEGRRDRGGDNVAGLILGIGALIVGATIADAARHKNRTRDLYED